MYLGFIDRHCQNRKRSPVWHLLGLNWGRVNIQEKTGNDQWGRWSEKSFSGLRGSDSWTLTGVCHMLRKTEGLFYAELNWLTLCPETKISTTEIGQVFVDETSLTWFKDRWGRMVGKFHLPFKIKEIKKFFNKINTDELLKGRKKKRISKFKRN